MNDIIRRLPESVANQIAAGEVIQRPASIVKELVENAVDAGATSVDIIIRDAGRTLVQVVDNGCGMTDTDARLAFERHATSKITAADDLFRLQTMGFRGEALASICAVAQVEMRTRRAEDDLGCRIEITGSKVIAHEPTACQQGTNIMVKNLFFNVPARRKFLKKDASEFSYIAKEFERMALVNPGLDLTLSHNDTIVHQLMHGSLKQRISDLFGKSVERQLIPVSTSTSIVTIEGFIGAPEHARRRNALKFLTVNGRHMRHPYFHKAIMHCYEQLIAHDSEPNYFLNFTVDPSTIDVNIHPTKNEIKFENESAIWQILVAAVREALGRFNAMPGIDFETSGSLDLPLDIPAFNPNTGSKTGIEIDTSYNPFGQNLPSSPFSASSATATKGVSAASWHKKIDSDWDRLYSDFMADGENLTAAPIAEVPSNAINSLINDDSTSTTTDATSIQVRNRFILSPTASGVMIIDQHRAHLTVLFENFRSTLRNGNVGHQQVLFPEVLNLSAQQSTMLLSIAENVREMGFEIAFLGGNTWQITAVPSMLADRANPAEILLSVIDDAMAEIDPDPTLLVDRMALSMARSAAIRAGHQLTDAEREQLIADLLSLPAPGYTPDGLPVIKMMSENDLESLF